MAKKQYQIPFDEDGEMMSYPDSYKKITWKDNFEFEATLEYAGYERGRSSTILIFRDIKTDKEYSMFMSDFDHVVPYLKDGFLYNKRFTFTKKGQNYGLKMID